jgi:phosphatidate cytidylyltransferase
MCDTGAYFTGRSLGKHKLILWLSPGKTWEGLVGGIALASVFGVLGVWLGAVSQPKYPIALGLATGVVFALLGQAGDLMMSLLKRDAGIKDSGRSLPGFGGILDVLDSPLLVAPFAYWWLKLLFPAG